MLNWDYYISLENDLLKCRRYVEFNYDNMNTFSIEFVRLFLAICSEIDVVAKGLCQQIAPKESSDNIIAYRNIIEPKISLSTFNIEVAQMNTSICPFNEWAKDKEKSPFWWGEHNDVKHNRTNNYEKATLKNNIFSLAGLFALNLYYHRKLVEEADLWPESKLFKPVATVIKRKFEGVSGYWLPGIENLGSVR